MTPLQSSLPHMTHMYPPPNMTHMYAPSAGRRPHYSQVHKMCSLYRMCSLPIIVKYRVSKETYCRSKIDLL
jgi:hypothetical protein